MPVHDWTRMEAGIFHDFHTVMPLFLTPDQYVNVPLEATYHAAYQGVPRFYRELLEA